MPDRSLNAFRREYLNGKLHERDLLEDPFLQFMEWMEDASRSGISEPNAMSLATADISGKPTVRIVLLKDARPDGFVFYTNYESSKARALEENPQASILFFWPELERQVRIEGKVDKISSEESDEFFRAR
ncbi:MAG: pyridoxal 5'-phosphate synthase, partial [Bacteroidota bacterium]